jgi:tetratricopeptide (TPR) repeat protein
MASLTLALLLAQQPDFEPLYRQALEQRRGAPREAESARDLALYLAQRGEFDKAAPYLRQTLAAGSGTLPQAAALHNWAVHLEDSAPDSAAALYLRALSIREKLLPPLDPELATTRLNLAALDLEKAEPLARQALAAFEKSLGPRHERTAAACGTLGAALAIKGDIAGAERYFRRALAIRETPEALENLADLLSQTGREAAARPLLDRAKTIRSRAR